MACGAFSTYVVYITKSHAKCGEGGKHVFVMEVPMMYLRFNLIFFFFFCFCFCFVLLVSLLV